MASTPNSLIRSLAGLSVSREYREDALTTFDEVFAQKYEEDGPIKAHLWSLYQAIRLHWGGIATISKIMYVVFKIGAFLFKIVP